ncbi:DUF1064 domain-containing protein (plasmid) [Fructilactobacillus ixorae]|uniref:DUF1064 domain-containing protein n=1 Tax=Fructilactobacillus ixorae TaxID=1750535 RepID=A0ABY5C5D5_9LACO|nr:DUF1064 domain-containing protein [Fructilactobacillus ixorae]USS93981.1 DUF1064 domain-containing protein [Fructilactobacillus ixorae]
MIRQSRKPIINFKTRDNTLRATWNKYHAKKSIYKDMVFDSKAEMEYFIRHIDGKHEHWKRQEPFELVPRFKLGKRTKRRRIYKPDFCLYDSNRNLVKVIDVKGRKITADASFRMNLLEYKLGMPVTVARFNYKTNMFEEEEF